MKQDPRPTVLSTVPRVLEKAQARILDAVAAQPPLRRKIFARALKTGLDPANVNPLGATGAILTLTCAYALRRARKRHGLVTMCIGGGQGISVVLESLAALLISALVLAEPVNASLLAGVALAMIRAS